MTLGLKLGTILSFASLVGLKALALLGILPDGDSPPENQAPPVTAPTRTAEAEEQREKAAAQAAAAPADAGPLAHCSVSDGPLLCSHVRDGAERLRAQAHDPARLVQIPALSDLGRVTRLFTSVFSSVKWNDSDN